MRYAMLVAILLVLGAAWACDLPEIDFTGKKCKSSDSCPTPLLCGSEGCCHPGPCKLSVSNLRADWQTPNTIRWVWETCGDVTELAEYTLDVTSDTPDAGGTGHYTRAENPELARGTLPHGDAPIPVLATITTGHTPGTVYRAVLTAKTGNGCSSTSNQADKITDVPPLNAKPIVIFGDDRAPLGFEPDNIEIVDGGGAVSHRHIEYRPDTDPQLQGSGDASVAFQNLRAAVSIDANLTPGEFDGAYVEVYVRYANGTEAGWWSEMWLRTVLPDGSHCAMSDECLYRFEAYTIPNVTDGGYRLYQFPLRKLTNRANGAPLTREALGRHIDQVNVSGTTFSRGSGTVVSLDGISIRY